MTLANEDAVETVLRVEPAWEVESSFDEEKLTISVPYSNREGREGSRDFEEEEDDEPLVIKIVAKAELAMEVREMGGAEAGGFREGREGESEGLVLP